MAPEIPDDLHALFHARLDERDGDYVVELPESEIRTGGITAGETYRVGLLETAESPNHPEAADESDPSTAIPVDAPVVEGEERDVVIEDQGDKGDGITRVGPGFVVFVPDTEPGDRVRIEITDVADSYGFGTVVEELFDNPSPANSS